jgi:hypothetical protein
VTGYFRWQRSSANLDAVMTTAMPKLAAERVAAVKEDSRTRRIMRRYRGSKMCRKHLMPGQADVQIKIGTLCRADLPPLAYFRWQRSSANLDAVMTTAMPKLARTRRIMRRYRGSKMCRKHLMPGQADVQIKIGTCAKSARVPPLPCGLAASRLFQVATLERQPGRGHDDSDAQAAVVMTASRLALERCHLK